LLTAGDNYLFADNSETKNQSESWNSAQTTLFPEQFNAGKSIWNFISELKIPASLDTMKTEKKEDKFIIPAFLKGKTFDFQVNSDISYHNFSHFVKAESKNMFLQAWLKENELKQISSQTDSLRKVYANDSGDRKEVISAQILKAEERIIALNQEIPALYEKVRNQENQYWQLATDDEITKFQKKIELFKDSVQQVANLQKPQPSTIFENKTDTFTFHKSPKKRVIKAEAQSTITYKIQVGSFKGKVPEGALKSIKKLSVLRKVENYQDEKGVTIYTAGNLKNYQDAVIMQKQIKQEGIRNAVIVAYQNGKRIVENEARKIKQ